MPEVDLSNLSGPELRGLLDSARARGQATLSYAILQEMADRRAGRFKTPRIVTLDLGDPLAASDEPTPKPAPAQVAEEPPLFLAPPPAPRRKRAKAEAVEEAPLHLAPPPAAAARRRRKKVAAPPPEPAEASVWDDVPESGPVLKLEGLPHPGRPGFARAAVFAAGIVLGGGAGFGAASLDLGRLVPVPAAEPPAELVRTAHQTLPSAAAVTPNAPPAQIQVVEVPPAGEPVAADFREAPLPEVEPTPETPPETPPEPSRQVAQAAPPPPVPAPVPETPKITLVKKESPEIPPQCAAKRVPADRIICADPQLRRLQKELRAAYGEALEVHEDRDTLRQRQLAWRDARNTVDDPDRLADLYAARIRKLHAAAEAAREGR